MTGSARIERIPLDGFVAPEVDLAGAYRRIWCLPHRFMVAAMPKPEDIGGFAITDKAKRLNRLPVGVCIAAGASTGLSVGDHVMVEAKFAKAVSGFSLGDWRCDCDVWMFGITSPHVRLCRIVDARHTAIAVLGHTDWEGEEAVFGCSGVQVSGAEPGWRVHPGPLNDSKLCADGSAPRAGRVLLELQPKTTRYGILNLPDDLATRPDLGIVADVSPGCVHVRKGDSVFYLRRGIECIYPDGRKNLAFCPEKAIYAVVREG